MEALVSASSAPSCTAGVAVAFGAVRMNEFVAAEFRTESWPIPLPRRIVRPVHSSDEEPVLNVKSSFDVIAPVDPTLNTLAAPATWKSRKFPANPLTRFIPSGVPPVDHVVTAVVPVGWNRSCGKVVVAVPPVNRVPVKPTTAVEAPALRL